MQSSLRPIPKNPLNLVLKWLKNLIQNWLWWNVCIKLRQSFIFFETKSDKKTTQNQITKLKEELENWKRIAQKQGVPIKTKLALTDNISHWVVDYVKENKINLLIVDYPKLSMEEITLFDDIINVIHHKSHCHLLTTKPSGWFVRSHGHLDYN